MTPTARLTERREDRQTCRPTDRLPDRPIGRHDRPPESPTDRPTERPIARTDRPIGRLVAWSLVAVAPPCGLGLPAPRQAQQGLLNVLARREPELRGRMGGRIRLIRLGVCSVGSRWDRGGLGDVECRLKNNTWPVQRCSLQESPVRPGIDHRSSLFGSRLSSAIGVVNVLTGSIHPYLEELLNSRQIWNLWARQRWSAKASFVPERQLSVDFTGRPDADEIQPSAKLPPGGVKPVQIRATTTNVD